MSAIALHVAALISYLAAAVLYGASLALRTRPHLLGARAAMILGVAIHFAAIGAFCINTHQSPFSSLFGTLSFAAWTVALIYLPVEVFAKVSTLGALASPVAAVLLFTAVLKSQATLAESPLVRSRIVSIHVIIVVVSFALFALAACCAVFYVWQYGLLKHPDRRALFRRLPPLETVDALAYHLVAFALPLLTLGLALGIVRAAGGGLKGNWLTDPHTLMSLAAWTVYAGYLAARMIGGWRGTRLNYVLIAGLAVTLALYFVPSTTHRFT